MCNRRLSAFWIIEYTRHAVNASSYFLWIYWNASLRCSLRFSMIEVHLMGLSISVCRAFHHIVSSGVFVESHCYNNDHRHHRYNCYSFGCPFDVITRDLANTSGTLMYSKELHITNLLNSSLLVWSFVGFFRIFRRMSCEKLLAFVKL
jgi:hypothetical protein